MKAAAVSGDVVGPAPAGWGAQGSLTPRDWRPLFLVVGVAGSVATAAAMDEAMLAEL